MKRLDVFSLVIGLMLAGMAGVALWFNIAGWINWDAILVAAPLSLVVIGILGLTLSRK